MSQPPSEDNPTEPGRGPSSGQPPQHPGPYPAGQYPPPGQYPPGQPGQYPPGQPGQYPPGQPGQYPPGQQAPYPPAGQGERYPTQQFAAPGPGAPYGPPGTGYPPPQGPGGATAYGVPPAPQRPDGGKRNLVIALVAGLVLLAAVVVAVVLVLNRDVEPVAVERTATSAPTTTAPTTTPSPSPTSEAPPPPGAGAVDELLAVVPEDFTDCAEGPPAGDGDIAAVVCGASATQPGPENAEFYLYEDVAALDGAFTQDVDAAGLEPLPQGEDCTTAQGWTTWNVGGVEGGEVACAVTAQGVLLAWTDREFGIEGIVTASGTTQEDLAALAEWWFTNSDFQG